LKFEMAWIGLDISKLFVENSRDAAAVDLRVAACERREPMSIPHGVRGGPKVTMKLLACSVEGFGEQVQDHSGTLDLEN